jgi:UDP-N-acetylmuramate dehydrogenase
MKVRQQADLRSLNTFGVPARAELLFAVESEEELLELPVLQPERDLVLGEGSNILLVDDVPGKVVLNRIRGIDLIDRTDEHFLVEVGAGENWHSLVRHAVEHGWHGLENLALIPGLAGAAPVQNIGAYGVELSEVLESVTAWDWQEARWVVFEVADCALAYRDSIFKQQPRDRWFITSIRLRLHTRFRPRLDYAGLSQALGSTEPTARNVMDTVVALRRSKLPDPARIGNAGSFFKNPVLEPAAAASLRSRHPGLPHWPQAGDQIKFSAAAMIQDCGLKGVQRGAAAVSDQHALVLVNRGGATGHEIWQLAQQVRERVYERFGVLLEPEPRIFSEDFTLGV